MNLKVLGDSIGAIFLVIFLCLVMMVSVNSCSASIWNDGFCSKCETRYELQAASNGLKYYACPSCGQEVARY